MALLFCDGFDHWQEMPHPAVWPDRRPPDLRVRRGLVVADLPTMRWVGAPPVTFLLSPCPDGEDLPASVTALREYRPD